MGSSALRLYSVDRGWLDGTTVGRQTEDGDQTWPSIGELSEPEGRPRLGSPGMVDDHVVEGTVAVAQSRRGHLVREEIPVAPLVLDGAPPQFHP